jgi:hypothetical protein
MPFTKHTLQEFKEDNKRVRCALCGQTWTRILEAGGSIVGEASKLFNVK